MQRYSLIVKTCCMCFCPLPGHGALVYTLPPLGSTMGPGPVAATTTASRSSKYPVKNQCIMCFGPMPGTIQPRQMVYTLPPLGSTMGPGTVAATTTAPGSCKCRATNSYTYRTKYTDTHLNRP
jgi:hypothetical protein